MLPCFKDHPERHAHCSKCVRIAIFAFLIFNPVWGLTETLFALVINFLINHDVGEDGFTNSNWKIRDITFIEHQEWELPGEEKYRELTPEKEYMIKLRDAITFNCSKPVDEESNKVIDDNCNDRIPDDNRGVYFCDVVEKPEVFRSTFRPLVEAWMVFNFLYLIPCPLMGLAIMWRTRRAQVFIAYCSLQIFPILTSVIVLLLTRSGYEDYDYILCSLDYLFDYFPLRNFFMALVLIKILLKAIEMALIALHIWELKSEKEKKAFGLRQRQRNRVVPLTTIKNEVLQQRSRTNFHADGDDASLASTSVASMSLSRMTVANPSTVIDILKNNAFGPRPSQAPKKSLFDNSARKSRKDLIRKSRRGTNDTLGSFQMPADVSLAELEESEDDYDEDND